MGPGNKILLAGTSLLAIAAAMAAPRHAMADTTITGPTTSGVPWAIANFTITNTGTISNPAIGITATDADNGTLTIFSGGKINATSTGILSEATAKIGTISNSGSITSSGYAIRNLTGGTITAIDNASGGFIEGGGTHNGVHNAGLIGTLTNSGTITATAGTAVVNSNTLTSLVNNSGATIQGGSSGQGLYNNVTITSLDNRGLIAGTSGIQNGGGTIGTLTNSGTISGSVNAGIKNSGTILTLSNSATIKGQNTALANSGTIGTLTNSGTINQGVSNSTAGVITTLNNSGTITASNGVGFVNDGTIGALTNSSVFTANVTGLQNSSGTSTITTLTNTGTLSGGTYAIYYTSGSIGLITDSGVIAGSIVNSTANVLSIAGGMGSTYGLLTGYNSGTPSTSSPGTVGSISNTSANVAFSSGNILLNDNIDVTGHTVSNSGATLKIQNTITISGQYSQSGGSLVIVTTSNGSSYGYMSVSSDATVTNSTITISGSGLSSGETFSIVRSGGTGTYTNDTASVSGTSGLSATVSTSSNNLVVTLANGTTYTQLGDSAGGAATGMGPTLDALNNSSSAAATAFQSAVLDTLDALPQSQQPAAVKELAPTQLEPALQVQTLAVAPTTAAIEQHQLALAEGGEVGMAAGSGGHNSAVWGQVIGGAAVRGTSAGADGYRSQSFGLVGGFEHQATADLTVGVAVSWLRGWSWGSDGSSGSSLKTDTYQLTGYGTQRWGRWFADGQLGVGYTQFREDRAIDFLGSTAHGKYDGTLYLAKAGVGYDFPVGGVTLTPLAGLRFLRVDSSGYTETGAGSADLTVDGHAVQSLTQDVGGELSWSLDTGWGRLTPEARLAWVHDYLNGPIAASGLMGGEAFTSDVARPSADGARLNLAATLDSSDDLSVRAEVEGEVRHAYESGTGLLKVTWRF